MLKTVKTNCPTYVDLFMEDGRINMINGKELNPEGVENIISYLGKEVDVTFDSFLDTVKKSGKRDGEMHLKMYNGAVSLI